jgi:predicted component of type VI protein secretion system
VDIIVTVKSKADQSVRSVRQPANGRVVLGRGPDSAVPLEAPGISREHLEVEAEDTALFLTDLSSNGTWLNGSRMPQRRKCRVADDDFIELPGYELRFQVASALGNSTSSMAVSGSGAAAAARTARVPAVEVKSRSLFRTFSPVEMFLLLVALASAALIAVYFAW